MCDEAGSGERWSAKRWLGVRDRSSSTPAPSSSSTRLVRWGRTCPWCGQQAAGVPCEQIVTGAAAHRRACRLDDPAGSTTVTGLRHQIAKRPWGNRGPSCWGLSTASRAAGG